MNKKRAELAVCAATERSQIIRFVFFAIIVFMIMNGLALRFLS